MKINLVNLAYLRDPIQNHFTSFTVDRYRFSDVGTPAAARPVNIFTSQMTVRSHRVIRRDSFVEFAGAQEDSIIYRGGNIGSRGGPMRKRKFLEDVLLLGSLLTASNWAIYSRRFYTNYPVTVRNSLRPISTSSAEITQDLEIAIRTLRDPAWQANYSNGFHLRALFNNGNLNNTEARFLSNMVLWEFLYAKIFGRESNNLQEIIKSILEHYWPGQVDQAIFLNSAMNGTSRNIFYVLRNQLAHIGTLPIDRPYAEAWMRGIPQEAPFGSGLRDFNHYFIFFSELTQVIVMKTIGINPESKNIFNAFDFSTHLSSFLSTGQI